MTSQDLSIGEGTRVTLHFSLQLESGQEVDSTFSRRPATLTLGDGNLPEGFEQLLLGLRAGDSETFQVAPEDAFGNHNPDNIRWMPRYAFPEDMTLEEGLVVSFADAARAELPGVVKAFDGDQVKVDFNHPLAGQPLTFEVRIIRVEP